MAQQKSNALNKAFTAYEADMQKHVKHSKFKIRCNGSFQSRLNVTNYDF